MMRTMSACCFTVSLKSSALGMDGLMLPTSDTYPFGIVSHGGPDGNIPELDCCGEAVGIMAISVDFRGKQARARNPFPPTPATPPRSPRRRPHFAEARLPTPRADAVATPAAALCGGCPCRCRGRRALAAAQPEMRDRQIFPRRASHHPR